MTDHITARDDIDTYNHRYRCSCGWRSADCPNGDPSAGAALVRHMLDIAKGGTDEARTIHRTVGRVP